MYLIPAAAGESLYSIAAAAAAAAEVFFFFTDSCQCALIKSDQITLFDNIYNRDFIITTSRESITKVCSQISAPKRDSCKERRRWRS
jgi:GTP1/Obg family GTP-binding protein